MTGSNPYDPQQQPPQQQPYPPQPYPPQPYPPQPYPPQPYTPYSYSGPQHPGQPEQYRAQQGRGRFVQRRSPIQTAMRLVMIGCLLFVLLNIVFFSCKSSRHNPSATEVDLYPQTTTSESATR